ncbi:MAG: DNA-3-methyladenine glycosylase I [Acidobacteriia bacterium]|nr:DNA-3-methyladenine glycosylase I [Terriglobia bacterium]
MSYCAAVRSPNIDPCHIPYHDTEYGFPVFSDTDLFERLLLEINQAGLSWTTVLKKRAGFREAYAQFHIPTIAAFNADDHARLMADPGIIRNRLKIQAATQNAQVVLELIRRHGSFVEWLHLHRGSDLTAWTKLFRKTFTFTGGEIVREFLMSTGYLPGAHDPDCPIYLVSPGKILCSS